MEKNKLILIFSEKNKMLLIFGEKRISCSLSGRYLYEQNVRTKRNDCAERVKKLFDLSQSVKQKTNSEVKTLSPPGY